MMCMACICVVTPLGRAVTPHDAQVMYNPTNIMCLKCTESDPDVSMLLLSDNTGDHSTCVSECPKS